MTNPTAHGPRLLTTVALTKLYGVVIGVNDVHLDLAPGVWGLLGPNGSGKSTLLKMITGQIRPTEGSLRVLGEVPWNNRELFHRIGLCPEQDAFYSFLSALEFVQALAELSGCTRTVARTKAEEALERVGATSFMNRPIATYSKGMRQRTKVAQALVHDPEFIILDEPLTGTDPVGRHEMIELVRTLGGQGKSLIISSHVLHEVEAMADSFLLIHGGRVLATGTVREIRSLLSDAPNRIRIRSERARELASRLLADLAVDGVDLSDDADSFAVTTRDPAGFFDGLARIVDETGIQVQEMHSQDDDLSAVFKYLISRV